MKKFLIIFVVFSLFVISCKEKEKEEPIDSITINANIEGSVNLYDESGERISNERMLVYLDGGAEYFYGETEKDGSFLILNAKYYPNYTIVYEKQGFGTYKKPNYNHEYTGTIGQIVGIPNLSKKSSTIVTQFNVEIINDSLHLEVTLGSKSMKSERYIRFLFHTIPEINHDVFKFYTGRFTMNANHHTLVLTKEYLEELGLQNGNKYYVQAYGASYYSNAYTDGKQVLPNLGYSDSGITPKDDFIMP